MTYKFLRFIDKHVPGDVVPEDQYTPEQIAQMSMDGRVALVVEEEPRPAPKPAARKSRK